MDFFTIFGLLFIFSFAAIAGHFVKDTERRNYLRKKLKSDYLWNRSMRKSYESKYCSDFETDLEYQRLLRCEAGSLIHIVIQFPEEHAAYELEIAVLICKMHDPIIQ